MSIVLRWIGGPRTAQDSPGDVTRQGGGFLELQQRLRGGQLQAVPPLPEVDRPEQEHDKESPKKGPRWDATGEVLSGKRVQSQGREDWPRAKNNIWPKWCRLASRKEDGLQADPRQEKPGPPRNCQVSPKQSKVPKTCQRRGGQQTAGIEEIERQSREQKSPFPTYLQDGTCVQGDQERLRL